MGRENNEKELVRFRDELKRDSEWLRELLIDHADSADDFDSFLGRKGGAFHPEHAKDIFEKDRIDLLKGVFSRLEAILGDEQQAAEWLFNNEALYEVSGAVPFDFLKDGDFDALWLLYELLGLRILKQEPTERNLEEDLLPFGSKEKRPEFHIADLVELLQATWGLSDKEWEQLLRVPSGWLRAWRYQDISLNTKVECRLRRLLRLHRAFSIVTDPTRYVLNWRSPWSPDSPLGNRSPWRAYLEDGDDALDLIETVYLAQR